MISSQTKALSSCSTPLSLILGGLNFSVPQTSQLQDGNNNGISYISFFHNGKFSLRTFMTHVCEGIYDAFCVKNTSAQGVVG